MVWSTLVFILQPDGIDHDSSQAQIQVPMGRLKRNLLSERWCGQHWINNGKSLALIYFGRSVHKSFYA